MSDSYFVHPTAIVEGDVKIGKKTRIWHHTHVREGAEIGAECTLSKGVYIDTDVRIGNRVKIQNGVSVYKGVSLEDDVFVGPNASFTNDLFPRSNPTEWDVIPTTLRQGSSVGANATIVCGVEIGKWAMIAAGAVVTENVLPFALMVGSPARLKGFVCRCGKLLHLTKSSSSLFHYHCDTCERELTLTFDEKASVD